MPETILIDPLSRVSLHLECCFQGTPVGCGTGFVITHKGVNYLITNWHVVTGRHPDTGQPVSNTGAANPDTIRIWYHAANCLGSWLPKTERLLDPITQAPRWREHPRGREIDVVALPLTQHQDVQIYPLKLSLAKTDLGVSPSEPVSIIGFPFGIAVAGKFPIWKTGHVASDIELDYEGKPVFLIDATTRPGMSGSPVVAKGTGIRRSRSGGGGGWMLRGAVRFLGVYSGRIRDQSDVGRVWKPEVLDSILP
jgi:hypothetical protein